jgi:hypothetical protein
VGKKGQRSQGSPNEEHDQCIHRIHVGEREGHINDRQRNQAETERIGCPEAICDEASQPVPTDKSKGGAKARLKPASAKALLCQFLII